VLGVKEHEWNKDYVLWEEDHEELSSSDQSGGHD
jgi:hypothetical protein